MAYSLLCPDPLYHARNFNPKPTSSFGSNPDPNPNPNSNPKPTPQPNPNLDPNCTIVTRTLAGGRRASGSLHILQNRGGRESLGGKVLRC